MCMGGTFCIAATRTGAHQCCSIWVLLCLFVSAIISFFKNAVFLTQAEIRQFIHTYRTILESIG